jgi:hypothetical protein
VGFLAMAGAAHADQVVVPAPAAHVEWSRDTYERPWSPTAMRMGALGGMFVAYATSNSVFSWVGLTSVALGALAGQYIYTRTSHPLPVASAEPPPPPSPAR